MFFKSLLLILIINNSISTLFSKQLNSTETCEELYKKGVEAYLEDDYESCVDYFETSLMKYKKYSKKLQNCRIRCHEEAQHSDPLFPIDIDNLLFYEKTLKNTLCIVKCRNESKDVFNNYDISNESEVLFERHVPYEYLHLCYFQTKQLQKAASAVFTYLVKNPDDKAMQANLKYYSEMEEVKMKEIVNYEAKDYVYLYVHGTRAYDSEDWNSVENYMEESLLSYLEAEDECRANCEGPFDQGWFPDFIPAIANHFTAVLTCKRKCKYKLNSLNGEKHEDLFPSHYHYLQYAYFKLKNLKAACSTVASYLLFYPDDEVMITNMKYYKKLPKVELDYFTPRPEAVHYFQRLTYEERIMKYINKEFTSLQKLFPDDESASTNNEQGIEEDPLFGTNALQEASISQDSLIKPKKGDNGGDEPLFEVKISRKGKDNLKESNKDDDNKESHDRTSGVSFKLRDNHLQ